MTRFRSYQDFFGTYTGDYDGRNARLKISDVKADSAWPIFHIEFTELDRNEVYTGNHTEKGNHGHIMTNITLSRKGGSGSVKWSKLYLHTWNIDHLSGVSLWNGIEFGMCFKRVHG